MPENKIYCQIIAAKPAVAWLDEFNPNIHPRLYQPFRPEALKRPPHEIKSTGGTAYILLEASTGSPQTVRNIGETCGAACRNCYLIRGGARPDYTPSTQEALEMRNSLEDKGFSVIFTGAELLSLPQHFKAGLFNEKPYLLTSGLIVAQAPEKALELISTAGINNIQMSLHGASGSDNVFNGIPWQIVVKAVKNILAFNQKFGTYIGVVLNVTVGKHNLDQLQNVADLVLADESHGGLDCNGLRFNRHKASGGRFQDLMLTEEDHATFYQIVGEIREKYPISTTGKTVNVSGDFGKLRRPSHNGKAPYECPAGIPGGEITIVPKKRGIHEVYSCLEVRDHRLQMGILQGGELRLHTAPFERLKDTQLRSEFGLEHDADGCIAYVITRDNSSAEKILSYLTSSINLDNANLTI
ncbi:hypothetical protein A3C98_01405 [Candidatus Roizmanbacteria bacterium RIFCSPHIGHO2_02_FULL_37_15]|uniref:Radical SAM core domain-containing protein n=1 Tax=Candidatus Roizmanbacteria bacterium RIFCSPLOWO2_01_FULL_37_16 TaxID=1802058 RepID=A0A1F7IQG7_9BACT|nr:MAG: hypothetical protein A2859_03220 [Candidatus Roizmanbacteria bacterium RIFCSPHIGHO2_01_FULL_37_16b]OGK21131.1 MAG: hypothetical protein A3C98_01405 [Candidatus Roizmanbacteria bacterium RIFCSPHIGHO2_02_FULL_37_15]OGK45609.1 MAG: hypothetical protein A3B40_00245 [Candidatus Roizmanbacteria bacterium RIFCSPLOWO2_01_FULL_37_16]OGK56006.1 MAG: hypothetical protein A3I50_02935 [Candidatus Roizmanbacteria bacterium RIFCSPLOWO2_02_FULL_37_9]